MKNLLRLFVFASLVLFAMLYYYSGQVKDHYQENASRYLDQALTEISYWEASRMKPLLAQEALAQVSDETLEKLVDHYRHLGRYQSMDEPQLSRISAALSLFGGAPKLSYSSRVTFEHGKSIMTATLTLQDQRFKLYNFNLGNIE
ncbi:hypothetical protein I6N98_02430 [Spongiibacter nanhainus]|uniref:Uncharacterized protein n=1 Tax=Spongiibacter nanhainus TaxID=2794344 RepID=A0A7T4R1I3_9GAMM|nr:hypothetical protein [Spongiibacter nanhainus]QQD18744.1 hypothetical protein I6N98_02430 [Spongiibacter nanhainus]